MPITLTPTPAIRVTTSQNISTVQQGGSPPVIGTYPSVGALTGPVINYINAQIAASDTGADGGSF